VASQYLAIALRWKWLILGCVAGALLLGVLVTLLATPQYTATTRLEISRESSRIVKMSDVEPETSPVDMEFYETQYGLLKSRALAERVARELRLTDDPKFFAMFGREDLVDAGGKGTRLAANRQEREQIAVEILLLRLEVTPIRLSRLVDVSWTSPDAAFSARVANAWANGFIQSNLERRFDATSYARKFLEDRLGQLKQKLEDSERQLVGYASDQAIINLPAGEGPKGKTQERSLTADSLEAMNEALAQATADRIAAQSRLSAASGGTAKEALANTAIASLRERRATAAAEYSRLLTQFEPQYPAAQALAAEIKELDASIAREEGRVRGSLSEGYRDSLRREQELQARVDSLKASFPDQRRRSIQYNIFQRDVDTNRELYDGLLQRYKEIGVAGGVGTNNVSIVDRADVPDRPSSPRPLINLLLALLGGLSLGVVLALLREQMDETIRDPAELEKKLGTPLLGVIPIAHGEDPREELKDPKAGLTEAYLSVQSSLAFASDHGIPQSLVVTSTRASEGKSTTAYAIAYWIARGGSRTLLMDADMRSPSVHGNLGLSNDRGLSNYLAGSEAIGPLLQRPEGEPMAVLTAGPQPPNAAELLRSPRFAALLAELRANFDHVIIDSPPVMGLADAPTVASQAEGTVFVIESRSVKERVARRALDRLRQGRAHIIGAVLTRFDPRRASLGYDYGYGYGYGSSYGDNAPTRKPA
jgi:capsular exopolysaccharide synthesis family protein